MSSEQYGLGPWYIATLVNEKGTELTYVHTDAYKAASVMNVLHPNDGWWVKALVGPFDVLQEALEYKQPKTHSVYLWTGEKNNTNGAQEKQKNYPKMKSLV